MPRLTPTVTPTNFSNSGSKQFTGQQASIYKILFFKEQNDNEYNDYQNSIIIHNTPVITHETTFPVQETVNTPYYVFKRNIDC